MRHTRQHPPNYAAKLHYAGNVGAKYPSRGVFSGAAAKRKAVIQNTPSDEGCRRLQFPVIRVFITVHLCFDIKMAAAETAFIAAASSNNLKTGSIRQ